MKQLKAEIHSLSQGRKFWWRDDDAERQTLQLQKLFELQIPIHLAVVPAHLIPFSCPDYIRIWQHGYAHKDFGSEKKKCELTSADPAIIEKLTRGYHLLQRKFGAQFSPILTPPWNHIEKKLEETLPSFFKGLSKTIAHPQQSNIKRYDISIDFVNWKKRTLKSKEEIYREILNALQTQKDHPIGLLSHHLIHNNKDFVFFEELIELISRKQFILL